MAVFSSDQVRTATLGALRPAVVVGPDLVLFVVGSAVAAASGNRIVAVVVAAWTVIVTGALAIYGLIEQLAGWGVACMVAASAASMVAAVTMWFGRLPLEWFFIGPFAFGEAGAASPKRHLRRSLGQLVVFWTAFFVVIPLAATVVEHRLVVQWPALDRPLFDWVGIVAFLAGCALGLWSCCTMALRGRGTPLPAATARELVIVGPYRRVRNPMALAGALQTAAIGLWLGSWIVIVLAGVGAVAWHLLIRPTEEADLADRFGDAYRDYRAHVRVWVPGRPRAQRRTTGSDDQRR